MTTTFLGFFMNRQNREEFVAPVIAADIAAARMELGQVYPESRYLLQTVYSRQELEHVLAGVDRWPGVASKVQPPLKADLSKVTASTGGLPPLPGQATAARVERVENNTQSVPAWMQSLNQPQAVTKTPVQATVPAPQQVTNMQAMLKAMSQTRAATPQPLPQQPQSLIERLKMARGESLPVQSPSAPIRREPTPVDAPVITRTAQSSVIDILKGMRK